VVDSQEEILWRLRALGGLKNTIGSRIVAIGGLGGWSQPKAVMEQLVQDRWKLDVQDVSYDDLGKLIQEARADEATVARSCARAAEYLAISGTVLDTDKVQVERSFLLDDVFRRLMREADCGAITVHHCMGTIMHVSETTACLTLSLLNDAGYLAFCESDFVAIPAGILLGNICGRPVFLNNPCYPHDGIITLAHCTAPRKMDGRKLEPTRIMTHFESDFGAAPKVDMPPGTVLTNIITDFAAERWLGLRAEIVDHPLLPICRSQLEIRYGCDSSLLAERMTGFHWMTSYGEYLREVGYALKRVPIQWEVLG
jgi:L-fucose isomerase-like protein